MKVHLHIDRLVMEVLGPSSMDAASLQRAISAELGRLMSGQDWSGPMRSESHAVIRGDSFAHLQGASPRQLGSSIANAVHGSLQQVQQGPLARRRS